MGPTHRYAQPARRVVTMAMAATAAIAASAHAQWSTVCTHLTGRLMTCRTHYTPPPAPAVRPTHATPTPNELLLRRADALDDEQSVFGVWRASGVIFESHGHRTRLEVRVTPAIGGIHLVVPELLALPGGTTFDLARVSPGVYRAADKRGRVTTFRVVRDRAELSATGTDGSGTVTYQFDERVPE